MIRINHDPLQCRLALERASFAVLDLETSGLGRIDRIISVGILIDQTAHILFVGSLAADVGNLAIEEFRHTLEPLDRPDLTVVFHNAVFDLGFLRRAGIQVNACCHDTLKLLRLLDQDRGPMMDDRADVRQPRRNLQAPLGAKKILNYSLKDTVRQLLHVQMREFPGKMQYANLRTHRHYLASDLLGTRKLYDLLTSRMPAPLMRYHDELVAPLTPILVEMGGLGIQADVDFIETEAAALDKLMAKLSAAHLEQYGIKLGMRRAEEINWLYGSAKLNFPKVKWNRPPGKWTPSLDHDAIDRLMDHANRRNLLRAAGSLTLIHDYRLASSLVKRLRSLLKYVDRDGRLYSGFNDVQASGRISSTGPNLQQVAKKVGPAEEKRFLSEVAKDVTIASRNTLVASAGHVLVSYDCKQADVRVLADRVARCLATTQEHKQLLHAERLGRLPQIQEYLAFLKTCRNPDYRGHPPEPPPEFQPTQPDALLEDFRSPGDFYGKAVERMLGRPPKDPAERNYFKPVILSVIYGKTKKGLAQTLKVSQEQAKAYLGAFEAAYPKEIAYKWLQYYQIAITGQTTTFMGRLRTHTAHHRMVSEPFVRLFIHYKRGDSYWVDCVPLRPGLRTLTTYTLQVVHAQSKRLIYDHRRGPLVRDRSRYRFFADEGKLVFLLPVRNWSWRNIRRVQACGEEATYEGFDATARSLFNAVCQGGTADLVKLMMLRCREACKSFAATMPLQIHDELVFEVPTEMAEAFIPAMKEVLEMPPCVGFTTPIQVGVKSGKAFGEME